MSAAWTTPPAAISTPCCNALRTEVGRVTTTSITAMVNAATTPEVGPSAHAMPARNAQTASSRTNSNGCEATR